MREHDDSTPTTTSTTATTSTSNSNSNSNSLEQQHIRRTRRLLLSRVQARDACECRAWLAATKAQQALVQSNRALRKRRDAAEAEVARLTRANQRLQHKASTAKGSGGGSGSGSQGAAAAAGSPNAAAVGPGLAGAAGSADDLAAAEADELAAVLAEDAEVERLRVELTGAYQRNNEQTQRILEMTTGIRALEDELSQCEDLIADRDAALAHAYATQKALEADVSEKELTAQVLQEELRALQGEVASMESDTRRLKAENDSLVRRILAKAEEDADKLNAVNAMYDDIAAKKAQVERESKAEAEAESLEQERASRPAQMSLLDRLSSRSGDAGAICPTKGTRLIEAHRGDCHHVCFSNTTGATIATGGSDAEVRLWDARICMRATKPAPKMTLSGHTQSILCVDFSAQDDMLVSASADKMLRVWNVQQGKCKHYLSGHIEKVTAAHFAFSDSSKIVSGSHDRSIKLWDLTKGYCTRTIFCYSSCNTVGISKDGRLVVSGHYDHSVRFWDTRSGDAVEELTEIHSQAVTSCVFHPIDDRYVLTNARDHQLAIVDPRTGRVLHRLSSEAYRNGVNWNHASFSPDGQFVCAGGADGGLFVWDTETGELATPKNAPIYLGTTSDVRNATMACTAWSPEGTPVACADKKGNLRLFE